MNCPVNIIYDFSFAPVCSHMFLPPPGTVPPAPTFAIDMIATQMWTAGYFLNKNKFTTTVLHKGMKIVIEGHDVGPLIPDITIPFVNMYYPLIWPVSSRKILISAFKVQMNGTPTACTSITRGMPMITCGTPTSLPTAFSIIAFLNTVIVGVELADIVVGIVLACCQMAGDLFSYAINPPGFSGWGMEVLGMFLPNSLTALGAAGAKMGCAALSGFLVSAVRHDQSGGTVPYSVPIQPLDTPLGGGSATYNWGSSDPSQNGWVLNGGVLGWQRQGNVSTPGPTNWSGSNWGSPAPQSTPSGGGGT